METWKRPRAGRKVGSPATSTFRNSDWRKNWQQCDDWDGEVGVSLPGSVSWALVDRQPTSLSSPRSRCCCDHPPVPPAPSSNAHLRIVEPAMDWKMCPLRHPHRFDERSPPPRPLCSSASGISVSISAKHHTLSSLMANTNLQDACHIRVDLVCHR